MRNYIPGDSLRRIHWRATARFDALIVRQLEAATSEDWWIFLDLDTAVQAGTGQDSTVELAIMLAASLAMRGLKERRRVGLALAGPKLIRLEPRSDPLYRWRILRSLSMAETGDVTLADLLKSGHPAQSAATSAAPSATQIFITPTNNPNWLARAGRPRRGDSLFVLLLDPSEFGEPADQSKIISALANNGIPYSRIPRSLLTDAYSRRGSPKRSYGIETGKSNLDPAGAAWQSME